jgi:hypothetical protein
MPKTLMPARLGVDITQQDASARFPLGTVVLTADGGKYKYVKNAAATAAQGIAFTLAQATHIATACADNGVIDGFNNTGATIAASYYFWMLVEGSVTGADGAAAITAEDSCCGGGDGKIKTAPITSLGEVAILAKCLRVRCVTTTGGAGAVNVRVR